MIEPIWIWAAFGIVLLTIEMTMVGTLDILWFGIAALCVSLAIWLFPSMPYASQFTMFAVLALGSLALWRLYSKKQKHTRGLVSLKVKKLVESAKSLKSAALAKQVVFNSLKA